MVDLINSLEIENFKSIKSIETDCKRVNVFIGKPNAGKSNILEAISVLGIHYSQSEKILSEFIRYEEISNLFYDDDLSNKIIINTDKVSAAFRYHANNIDMTDLAIGDKTLVTKVLDETASIDEIIKNFNTEVAQIISIDEYFIRPLYTSIDIHGQAPQFKQNRSNTTQNPIKRYDFSLRKNIENKFPSYLLPDGSNLFTIVDHNAELRKEIAEIFAEYKLQFVAYKKESKFEIEKKIDGYVYKYPYSNMADTFQRLVFYFAAIDSNKDSVIILEEPEVHSFPPYTKELSQRIVDSKHNQFFITTHSPYLLQNLISELDSTELNLFVTYFDDYQTKIRKLSEQELKEVAQFDVDLFYNLNKFVNNA
jgi:AAA15 family ATPase/GTPase